MFGSLFEENDAVGLLASSLEGSNTLKCPDSPRNMTGLAGIENQGATCFLNCTLQVLAFTPEFKQAMLALEEKELGRLEDKEHNKQVREIPIQIQRLFASLMLENKRALSSEDLTKSFGWSKEQTSQQHDALELNQQLLDAIHRSLKGTAGEPLMENLFHFRVLYKIECYGCGRVSESKSSHDEFDLNVPVAKCPKGLEQSLNSMFCTPEIMSDSNKYFCSFCNDYVENAARSTKLQSLPPILKISLLRFTFEKNTYKRIKISDNFPFPLELDMSKYTEDGQPQDCSVYELYGVISHSGSCYGGHYVACIRDIDSLGHWEKPEPEVVRLKVTKATSPKSSPGKEPTQEGDVIECRDPEELVSVILASQLNRTMTIDKLSAEIYKQTGVPWARSFKRRHGSFTKFIRDHPERFFVQGNNVTLLDSPTVSNSVAEAGRLLDELEMKTAGKMSDAEMADQEERSGLEGQSDSTTEALPDNTNDNCQMDIGGGGDMVNGFRGSHKEDKPPPGRRWFLFNDSNVSAMEEADLAQEFSGKKCAYLLWYRKKNLPRPPEAIGNKAFGVPLHLMEEIELKNAVLERERAEYAEKEQELKEEAERKTREVNFEIRFGFYHRMEKGVLKSDEEPVKLTCERKQTLDELFEMLVLLGGDALGPKFHVHRMRCWDDKAHLYDELTDRSKTLDELSIEEGTILFAWDGQQVKGQVVPTGLEQEPITLKLKKYCTAVEIVHHFPRNTPLTDFRAQVSALTGVPLDNLLLQFPEILMHGEQEPTGGVETLESIHLRDNACILFDGGDSSTLIASPMGEASAEAVSEDAESGFQFVVRIENRCDEEIKSKYPVLELEINKDMTIAEVKQTFMTMYSIDCQTAAIRENDSLKGLQTPYNENNTVREAGIISRTRLVLDNTMMTLAFRFSHKPDSPAMQVSVPKSCTVNDCLLAVGQVAELTDPYVWHLRKTNFLGEPCSVLGDLEATLFLYAVNPGDFLILEQGALLARNDMKLQLNLYPSPIQYNSFSSITAITNRVNDLLISRSSKDTESCTETSFSLGEIIIDKDATLDDLRERVVELLALDTDIHVNKSQIRISMVEGKQKRLRRILRSRPYNTLRRMKVTGGASLGVQVVALAADPSPDEIVLNLRERLQENKTYKTPEELVWDYSHGANVASLKLTIACQLRMPQETFVIAKHFPDEFQWKILTDNNQTQSTAQNHQESKNARNAANNRRGRRKQAAPKPNIRQKPFFVQDGDEVGVLILTSRLNSGLIYNDTESSQPNITDEDFSTVEDDMGREQLLEEQRQKQNEREAKKLVDGWMSKISPRPEVPLTIAIGDFT